ncbi:hypothetical protein ACS33_01455 [Edwardsiella ictaluri]|uniref:Uncharacterized protein n=1 Tax=Edwardsiella ictaluri TaxID=67780 RepID=A0ABY8GJD3_EDWIC|nr:hypothetical protein [Edwardsiella ictaluri]KMQ78615.1 hypothetical protein ABY58_07440 [Edwardsiella ictaluri]KOO56277.1 hypothetical protein ACS33_01455 [Edwardsiella ictaluri]WFN97576.1 hypothetical protein MAY91_06030 [Edwardsiella ictaluri]
MLAVNWQGNELLNNGLIGSGKTAVMYGSLSIICTSCVNSLRVGDIYCVGHLPWWKRLWYIFSSHPFILAALALLAIILVSLVLWQVPWMLRRRLDPDDRKISI